MSSLDALVADTIAARVFARAQEAFEEDDVDDARQYFARKAFKDAESETKLVEALSQRSASVLRRVHDPALVEDVKRLAQTAFIHYRHARAAASRAEGDPVFGPLARRAVARARAAARIVACAAARAVLRARATTRSRIGETNRIPRACRLPRRSARRHRAPARLAHLSGDASAGAGDEAPGPEPPPSAGPRDGLRPRARGSLSRVQRRSARERALDPVAASPQRTNQSRAPGEAVRAPAALHGDVGRRERDELSRTPWHTCVRAAASGDADDASRGREHARLARLDTAVAIEIAGDVLLVPEVRR